MTRTHTTRYGTLLSVVLALALTAALAACGGGESKEDIIAQTWDCWAQGDTEVLLMMFEQSMLMMFPTASKACS